MNERTGRCHDCTAQQTETNMLCRHILELQKDKGELIDSSRKLEDKLANADYQLEGRDLEIKELKEQLEQAKEIIRAICEGYASTIVGENEMIERIQKAEAFLKE